MVPENESLFSLKKWRVASVSRESLPVSAAFALFLLIILTQIGGEHIFFRLFPKATRLEVLWFIGSLRLFDFGLIVLFIRLYRRSLAAIGMGRDAALRGISRGLWWSFWFGLVVFSAWGTGLIFRINLFRFLCSPTAVIPTVHFVWLVLIGGILAPVVEDSLFIGCLYHALRKKFPALPAALGISLLFALLHGFHGSLPVVQFVGGVIFALAFEHSGSILTPISIHILGNCTLFALSYQPWLKDILLRW
jgi:membrane protease YdiL (CAAX protease family)